MRTIDFVFSYVLAFWSLLGYWVAEIMGITGSEGWVFSQAWYVLVPVLTVWYGTWLLPLFLLYTKIRRKN